MLPSGGHTLPPPPTPAPGVGAQGPPQGCALLTHQGTFWAAAPRSSGPQHRLWPFQVSPVLLWTGFRKCPLTSSTRAERSGHPGAEPAEPSAVVGSLVRRRFPAASRPLACGSGTGSTVGDGAGVHGLRLEPVIVACTQLRPRNPPSLGLASVSCSWGRPGGRSAGCGWPCSSPRTLGRAPRPWWGGRWQGLLIFKRPFTLNESLLLWL